MIRVSNPFKQTVNYVLLLMTPPKKGFKHPSEFASYQLASLEPCAHSIAGLKSLAQIPQMRHAGRLAGNGEALPKSETFRQ